MDRTIRHTQERAGNIERLSVAVVVNYATDTKGKEIALSQEKMDQINNLVREAMGFSQSRGDTLSVVNTPFNSVEDNGGELPFWQKQSFIDLLTTLGRYLLVALVAWLLWRKLVKPMLTKQQLAAAAAQQRVDAPPLSVQPAKQPSNEELQQRRKLQQRSTAEAQTERVREMAEQDPRVVALVIRQWMSTEQQ